jgi:hypothetical protein
VFDFALVNAVANLFLAWVERRSAGFYIHKLNGFDSAVCSEIGENDVINRLEHDAALALVVWEGAEGGENLFGNLAEIAALGTGCDLKGFGFLVGSEFFPPLVHFGCRLARGGEAAAEYCLNGRRVGIVHAEELATLYGELPGAVWTLYLEPFNGD